MRRLVIIFVTVFDADGQGRAHTIVVAVHDQVTDSVGVARQRIEF
jgi:hypothetical protein